MYVSLIVAMSLDGFIAQIPEQSSLEWTSKADKRFFVRKTKEIGTLIMGRKTFDTIGKQLPGRRMIVLTRAPEARVVDGVEFTDEAPEQLLKRLRDEGVRHVAVLGGTSVYRLFLGAGLVTDVYATIEPIVFGEGVPFLDRSSIQPLTFVETQELEGGAVVMHYTVV